ncbi:MAG: hypothetical protein JNK78_20830 [Planctomycetes bacterium]|nr:hypothetical protein [Planctomycetota bacterium]
MTTLDVPQISLQRYVELLKRRRWQVIPVSLLGLLIGGIVAFFIPRYYVAETLIQHQAVPGKMMANADDPFHSIVESAYWTIPLAVTKAMEELKWPEAKATGYELQENERAVRSRLGIYDINQGQPNRRDYAQIRITFKDRDGPRSAAFLNMLVKVWIQKRIDELRQPAEDDRAAAAERVRALRRSLDQLTIEKQLIERKFGIDPTIPENFLYTRLRDEADAQAELRRRRDDATREVAVMERALAADREKLDGLPTRVKEDPAVLIELVSKKPDGPRLALELVYFQNKLANFQPGTGPHAEALRNIAATEARLRALIADRDIDAEGFVPNPAYETLRKAIAAGADLLAAKKAELEIMNGQVADEEQRVVALSEGYAKYHTTRLDLADIEKDYGAAQADLRSAEALLTSLGKEKPVRQSYEANAPPRPTDPSILLVSLLGCVLGLGFAVGMILLLDVVQGTFKTIDEVERGLPVPVLGGMSHLETDFERETVARKRRRVSLAAAAFLFLCVAVVTIFYVDATRLPPFVRDLLALLLGRT